MCATDVTGSGLLGHLHKLSRAGGLTAHVDLTAVPYPDGARDALGNGEQPPLTGRTGADARGTAYRGRIRSRSPTWRRMPDQP